LIVAALALVVLALAAPGVVLLLVVPVAIVWVLLPGRHKRWNGKRDAAELVVSVAAALAGDRGSSDGAQEDWAAALRAELACITVLRERRRFALGAALALLGPSHWLRSGLIAAGMAVSFGVVLLSYSRANSGDEALGTMGALLPPVMLFAGAFACARSSRSLRFGLETGILATVATLVAVAVVFGVEAAHWFSSTQASVVDGEYAGETVLAAVRDAVHPVILHLFLQLWLPWPVLGAIVGVRVRRRGAPSARPSS
jgi:hypothetical protein